MSSNPFSDAATSGMNNARLAMILKPVKRSRSSSPMSEDSKRLRLEEVCDNGAPKGTNANLVPLGDPTAKKQQPKSISKSGSASKLPNRPPPQIPLQSVTSGFDSLGAQRPCEELLSNIKTARSQFFHQCVFKIDALTPFPPGPRPYAATFKICCQDEPDNTFQLEIYNLGRMVAKAEWSLSGFNNGCFNVAAVGFEDVDQHPGDPEISPELGSTLKSVKSRQSERLVFMKMELNSIDRWTAGSLEGLPKSYKTMFATVAQNLSSYTLRLWFKAPWNFRETCAAIIYRALLTRKPVNWRSLDHAGQSMCYGRVRQYHEHAMRHSRPLEKGSLAKHTFEETMTRFGSGLHSDSDDHDWHSLQGNRPNHECRCEEAAAKSLESIRKLQRTICTFTNDVVDQLKQSTVSNAVSCPITNDDPWNGFNHVDPDAGQPEPFIQESQDRFQMKASGCSGVSPGLPAMKGSPHTSSPRGLGREESIVEACSSSEAAEAFMDEHRSLIELGSSVCAGFDSPLPASSQSLQEVAIGGKPIKASTAEPSALRGLSFLATETSLPLRRSPSMS